MPGEPEAAAEAGASATAPAESAREAAASGTPSAGSTPEESGGRISPWWLLVAAIATGVVLTAIADLISGGEKLSAIEWLGTTVGVAALVIAVGIYRLQDRSAAEAHAELMDQLEAQNELLNEFAERATSNDEDQEEPDSLTPKQRTDIEERFGKGSIAAAIEPGLGRGGKAGRARLVRLTDGRLLSVYDSDGRFNVREIPDPRDRSAARRQKRPQRGGR